MYPVCSVTYLPGLNRDGHTDGFSDGFLDSFSDGFLDSFSDGFLDGFSDCFPNGFSDSFSDRHGVPHRERGRWMLTAKVF